jgi:hypothetical protein
MDPTIPHDQVRMVIAALRLLQNDILYRKLKLAEEVMGRPTGPITLVDAHSEIDDLCQALGDDDEL